MNTSNNISKKRIYTSPIIGCVKLDNEISLALESTPPTYELVNSTKINEYFNNDPFKTHIS
jgi:hypothetical protein